MAIGTARLYPVEVIRRLRSTERFDGVEALKAQLGRDAQAARIALTQA